MSRPPSGSPALRLCGGLLLCALSALVGCHREDPAFASPAATFKTYKNALAAGDMDLLWSCLSASYRASAYGDDRAALTREWEKDPRPLKAALRREIAGEQLINERIGYLLFDATTLAPQVSPFFYFIREPEGWKITTHLDSLFHRELEQAIARGEFKLPSD